MGLSSSKTVENEWEGGRNGLSSTDSLCETSVIDIVSEQNPRKVKERVISHG